MSVASAISLFATIIVLIIGVGSRLVWLKVGQ
jgi:hypothetical protein